MEIEGHVPQCPNADGAACLPTTVTPASGRTAVQSKRSCRQLVERQVTATYKSVQSTVSALDVVIRAHTLTTDADVDGCPRRVLLQTRAVDV